MGFLWSAVLSLGRFLIRKLVGLKFKPNNIPNLDSHYHLQRGFNVDDVQGDDNWERSQYKFQDILLN